MIKWFVIGVVVLAVMVNFVGKTSPDRYLERAENQAYVEHSLDNLVTFSLPETFILDSKTLYDGYYYVDIPDSHYSYVFMKDAFTAVGGVSARPIELKITVYDRDVEILSSFSDSATVTQVMTEVGIMTRDIRSPRSLKYTPNKSLQYIDAENKVRVDINYAEAYLADTAAESVLEQLIPTIIVNGDVSTQVRRAAANYYELNPDKKYSPEEKAFVRDYTEQYGAPNVRDFILSPGTTRPKHGGNFRHHFTDEAIESAQIMIKEYTWHNQQYSESYVYWWYDDVSSGQSKYIDQHTWKWHDFPEDDPGVK